MRPNLTKFSKIDADQGRRASAFISHFYMIASALSSLCAVAGGVAQKLPISAVSPIACALECGLHDHDPSLHRRSRRRRSDDHGFRADTVMAAPQPCAPGSLLFDRRTLWFGP